MLMLPLSPTILYNLLLDMLPLHECCQLALACVMANSPSSCGPMVVWSSAVVYGVAGKPLSQNLLKTSMSGER